MMLGPKCLEPVTAISSAIIAAAVGLIDPGVAVGAAVGGAGLLARFRESRTKLGLDDKPLIDKMQKAIFREMDRWDIDLETRDALTLADAAMAEHLQQVMLTREELAAASISQESFYEGAARLVADRLAECDAMFAVGRVEREFALRVISSALNAVNDDPAYASVFTRDLVLEGNRAHDRTYRMLGETQDEVRRGTDLHHRTHKLLGETSDRLQRMQAEQSGAPPLADPWLDLVTGRPLLVLEMPSRGESSAEIHAKAQLYGGQPGLECTPLDFVALGHSFDREKVTEIGQKIRANQERCSSYTLAARHGCGLSLALAQLVRDFHADQDTVVLSVIGDRPRTLRLLNALGVQPEHFVSRLSAMAAGKQRLLLVIDDVRGDRIGDRNLVNFRNLCSRTFVPSGVTKLTFVFGSFPVVDTLDEHGLIELRLTEADRAACYAKMAKDAPTIIEGYRWGPPPEARRVGDDAQALIDFHLQYGNPREEVVEHWLARIDDLEHAQRDILALVATAGLLDLAVPGKVALALPDARGVSGLSNVKDLIAANDRLTLVDLPNPAIALSCPWRARSILDRSGRYGPEFLVPSFLELLEAALALHRDARRRDDEHGEFARHIFQRLGKREYYPIEDAANEDLKDQIGRDLLAALLDSLRKLSADWSLVERARWAGTIARWLDGPGNPSAEPEPGRELREISAEFVVALGEHCIASTAEDEALLEPAMALSLLRASRRLLSAGLFRGKAGKARRFAEYLDYRLSRVGILNLIQAQMEQEHCPDELSYRGNELLTAYCQFKAQLEGRLARDRLYPGSDLCREMTKLLYEAGRLFATRGAAFDAGAWIERARYIWVDNANPGRKTWALARRHDLLLAAQRSVDANPVTQATWHDRVKTARKKFLDRAGPC